MMPWSSNVQRLNLGEAINLKKRGVGSTGEPDTPLTYALRIKLIR